jgi:hypothetical protein
MGGWFMSLDGGAGSFCSLGSTANNTNFFDLVISSGQVQVNFNGGGTVQSGLTGVFPAMGNWFYAMAGGVSATSKWVACFDPNTGSYGSGTSSSSATPAINGLVIGGRRSQTGGQNIVGLVAEWFLLNATPLGNLSAGPRQDQVMQAAFNGIWSVPTFQSTSMDEYKSFMQDSDVTAGSPLPTSHVTGYNYQQIAQIWTVSGQPTIGPPCPYVLSTTIRPPQSQIIRNVII